MVKLYSSFALPLCIVLNNFCVLMFCNVGTSYTGKVKKKVVVQ